MPLLIRMPKPTRVRTYWSKPLSISPEVHQKLVTVADLFQLGEIKQAYGAPQSNSLNIILETDLGKFVFRKHSLSEETVAHEHEVLTHLQISNFPAPQMHLTQSGDAWVNIDGALYSMYTFVQGYCPADFIWAPQSRQTILEQAGAALGTYHHAVKHLRPLSYKWDAYQPNGRTRWRDGDFYRSILPEIRAVVDGIANPNSVDVFAQQYLDDIEQMISLESEVESCLDLTKLVIHGDYAPWNILLHSQHPSPFILDFNSARLDLKIFDVMLGTFFFAWHRGHLDQKRATAFQKGYRRTNSLKPIELDLASPAFQWVMGRSLVERLRTHYLEKRFLLQTTDGLTQFYTMCIAIQAHSQQFLVGLSS